MSSILVTGATGSFGSAFVRQCLTTDTYRRVIVFSRDELKQSEMQRTMTDPRLRFFIGDIRDLDRLRLALRGVDTVVHAAALKQVPAMEANPMEAIATNVLGSMNVFRAALDCGVSKMLALSTDKAVAPVNLYGASKLAMERALLAANAYAGPKVSVVRYGNVAGSRGSVVPLWKWQRLQGQPLTMTSPDMTRFWIDLPRAVAFVRDSLTTMQGGEVFVPKMASVRVTDLAQVIGGPVTVTGIRPGEKLHEQVVAAHEHVAGLPSPYASDTNDWWLEGDALQQAVAACA